MSTIVCWQMKTFWIYHIFELCSITKVMIWLENWTYFCSKLLFRSFILDYLHTKILIVYSMYTLIIHNLHLTFHYQTELIRYYEKYIYAIEKWGPKREDTPWNLEFTTTNPNILYVSLHVKLLLQSKYIVLAKLGFSCTPCTIVISSPCWKHHVHGEGEEWTLYSKPSFLSSYCALACI